MNRRILVDVSSALFSLLFTYTAVSKLLDHEQFVYALNQAPIVHLFSRPFAIVLPVLELITVFILLRRSRLGMWICFGWMLAFTIYLALMLLFAPELPCSCGGVISSLSWQQHFLFNTVLLILSLTAAVLGAERSRIEVHNNNLQGMPKT